MVQSHRMKPPQGEDNHWWWEQAQQGKLTIQRCQACGDLRHPPRPMCGQCRSIEWDFIESSGKGRVASFTVMHHPQFPGFDYPLIIVLVDLEEGTRFTAQLLQCEPEQAQFDMPVEMVIHTDPDGFKLPMFKPAGAA